jgi:phage terminase small subunit
MTVEHRKTRKGGFHSQRKQSIKPPCLPSHTRPSPRFKKDSTPPHLRPETAEWWAEVNREFDLEHHHRRLLRLACEAWDRGQEAREAIAEHGSVYVDRFGQPRARPEVAIERDSRISFARMLRELALDVEGPTEGGRPPRIAGKGGLKMPQLGGSGADLDEEDQTLLGLI